MSSAEILSAKQAADAAYRSQQYADAVAAYSRAIELSEQARDPSLLHLLYSNRSAARLALKDFQGALADAQQSVAVNDSWVKGWYRSAKALQGLGKLEQAAQAARKAQQLEPSNQDVRVLLQELLANKQQQQQQPAEQPAQPSVQQQPQQQMVQQLPWAQLNALRSKLDLKRLPQQLVVGSRYLPSPDGVNHNLLLLLHGLGDTPAGFTALARRMALPQTACLALSGPLTVPETEGGRAWLEAFDDEGEYIMLPRPGDTRRTDSLAITLALMQHLLFEVLPQAGGWRPSEIQLLGFSQGGCVALNLARLCSGARQLGGAVAVCAGLLHEQLEQLDSSSSGGHTAAAAGTPALITWGDRDELVTRSRADRTVDALQAAGCDVQLKVLAGKGHSMIDSEPEMRACMTFWSKNLKQRPADAGFEEVH